MFTRSLAFYIFGGNYYENKRRICKRNDRYDDR